jgi:hypothetical protein
VQKRAENRNIRRFLTGKTSQFLTHLLLNPYNKLSTKYIRSTLVNRGRLLKTGSIFEKQAYAGVVQDKAPQVRYTTASEQPSTADEDAVDNPKKHGSETRQTAHVSARVPHHVKTGLQLIEEANGWTESKTVATACEAYLEQDLGEKFGRRLAAQVAEAVRRVLQAQGNRQAYLSAHACYTAEEARIINTKVLRYLFGEDTEIYNQIVKEARKEARENIRRSIDEKT